MIGVGELPTGLEAHPLTLGDSAAVTALMTASEVAVLGRAVIDESSIVADWSRPSFDITASTIGVFHGSELVGYAEVNGPGRGDAAVHPDHLGRGIGSALARWMQATARAQGQAEIGMPVPALSPGERLLRDLGYHQRWTSWVLTLPADREVVAQPLPEGYTLRHALPDDLPSAYHVVEDAFLEWSVRDKQSYPDWLAGIIGHPGHQPWNLQVVLDPAGSVVAAVHVTLDDDGGAGFVDKIAVRADQRGNGLARVLLAAAFAAARDHGAQRSELSTDSRTGALDLYLGVGMEIESTWVNLGITL